ncbi:dNTP triphosphohydrolase [Haloechinothrix sp. YIM 98757]|uniref:DNTP triphosphohydrolase n=1 Tax=Haloechinothrix aidingensis TaxID=2752311 RepID=A0A838A3Q6_9PSEU|nr:dNTP triphosphohydrolase [Haloechinothrix aidingensis]MBA0125923.1 dNTP triphosphohydrolase [Haloechinothrix aidingensis]
MTSSTDDAAGGRTARRDATAAAAESSNAAFRTDRDRIATSPFFARLGGVTQVVSTTDSGLLHNRLTHSLKVAQVARAIADRLTADASDAAVVDKLGGCDPDVVEAAALAHDLGHPPFGHLGEQVLDEVARERFGLTDGFEGNAQTFRILTTTDVRGPTAVGLDLTAAVRAAVLKYPWARLGVPQPHPSAMAVPPRGAGEPAEAPGTGSSKYSAYFTELDDVAQAREPFRRYIEPWQQTVEASVMDTADDIAYAIHDLQDFHRIGVLQQASVAGELEQWTRHALELSTVPEERMATRDGRSGYSLERLRRRLHAKDSWIVDDDAFAYAVARVRRELVDGLLAAVFDGSVEAEQAIAEFSTRWTERLVEGIVLTESPSTRSGHVTLRTEQWHEVQILKWVHSRFVLLRPDLALHQRGQASLLRNLVRELDEWVRDGSEWYRIPRRLHDLVELATTEYQRLDRDSPELLRLARPAGAGHEYDIRTLARGRAIVDFVASLTDKQGVALLDSLSGRALTPWSESFVL